MMEAPTLETLLILVFHSFHLISALSQDHLYGSFPNTRTSHQHRRQGDGRMFEGNFYNAISLSSPSLFSRDLNGIVVVVNQCLDATDYFNHRFNDDDDGVNNLRKYYECTCTGDLRSKFTLDCELNNHCFVGQGENDTTAPEQCISRKVTYDFVVNANTRIIEELARSSQSTTYQSGFSFVGTFTTVGNPPCVNELHLILNVPTTEEAIDICDNRTACQEFFLQNTNRTLGEIEYICPYVTFKDIECKNPRIDRCSPDDGDIRYFTMPDCSNVDPCLATSCQPYPREDNMSLQSFLFRYPECDHETIIDTDVPTTAPIEEEEEDGQMSSTMPSSSNPTAMPSSSSLSRRHHDSSGFGQARGGGIGAKILCTGLWVFVSFYER